MKTFTLLAFSATFLSTASASLFARQLDLKPSDIPSQCTSQCTPMVTTLNGCDRQKDLSCGCSSSTKDQISSCFACLVGIAPSVESSLETGKQAFVDGCKAAGIDVGSFSSSSSGSSPSGSANGGANNVGSATGSATSPASTSTAQDSSKSNAAAGLGVGVGTMMAGVLLVSSLV
ncbi:hypothetical protein DL96DRAFT_1710936 [Flagelloscypha sp. PMI_526]|nr:hypothetical protein DL96DRAFT_1710936 [Flagelloscypha sp. PMI_526]